MENKEKLGQEPAFAKQSMSTYGQRGMSKRFYAACAAMQGILAGGCNIFDEETCIVQSFVMADELLKKENL